MVERESVPDRVRDLPLYGHYEEEMRYCPYEDKDVRVKVFHSSAHQQEYQRKLASVRICGGWF